MFCEVLIVLLTTFVILAVSEDNHFKKCCIVSAYDLGMIVYSTTEKNVDYRSSTTQCGVQLKTFSNNLASYKNWIVKSSNENSKLNLVIDQRWESLPCRITGDISSTYLSLKPSSNTLENLGCYKNQWCHIFVRISKLNGTSNYIIEDTNKVLTQVKEKNVLENSLYIKIHKHNYLWTNLSTNTIIYEGKTIRIMPSKSCISLYLAMCKECKITITEKETNTQKNVTGSGTWTREHICSNFSQHLTIQVSTHSEHKNRYWAIGDIFYFHCNGTSESQILGQRNIILYPDESKCENVNNIPIESQSCYKEEKEELYTFSTIVNLSMNNLEKYDDQEENELQASTKLLYLLLIIPAIVISSVIFCVCRHKKSITCTVPGSSFLKLDPREHLHSVYDSLLRSSGKQFSIRMPGQTTFSNNE